MMANMPSRTLPDVSELMLDDALIDGAVARGVREALLEHKRRGESIVVWRDGRVVVLPPDSILVNGDDADPGC